MNLATIKDGKLLEHLYLGSKISLETTLTKVSLK